MIHGDIWIFCDKIKFCQCCFDEGGEVINASHSLLGATSVPNSGYRAHTQRVNISVFWLTSTKGTQRPWRFILFIAALADPVNQVCSFTGKHRTIWDSRKKQLSLLIQGFTSPYLLSFQSIVVLFVKRCSECGLCFPQTLKIPSGSMPGIVFGPGMEQQQVYTPPSHLEIQQTCPNHDKLSPLNELGNFCWGLFCKFSFVYF